MHRYIQQTEHKEPTREVVAGRRPMNTSSTLKLLAIDDDRTIWRCVARHRQGLEIAPIRMIRAGLRNLPSFLLCVVLLDLVMPGVSGIEILERIVSVDPGVEVILITAHYSAESAVELSVMTDLTKPIEISKLRAIDRRSSGRC